MRLDSSNGKPEKPLVSIALATGNTWTLLHRVKFESNNFRQTFLGTVTLYLGCRPKVQYTDRDASNQIGRRWKAEIVNSLCVYGVSTKRVAQFIQRENGT